MTKFSKKLLTFSGLSFIINSVKTKQPRKEGNAMAKKKNFYYVLVFTNNGPVYVTKVDNANKVSYWHKDEQPLELGKSYAEQLAWGLRLNGTNAVVVWHAYEIETQPYNYDDYECKFEMKG